MYNDIALVITNCLYKQNNKEINSITLRSEFPIDIKKLSRSLWEITGKYIDYEVDKSNTQGLIKIELKEIFVNPPETAKYLNNPQLVIVQKDGDPNEYDELVKKLMKKYRKSYEESYYGLINKTQEYTNDNNTNNTSLPPVPHNSSKKSPIGNYDKDLVSHGDKTRYDLHPEGVSPWPPEWLIKEQELKNHPSNSILNKEDKDKEDNKDKD